MVNNAANSDRTDGRVYWSNNKWGIAVANSSARNATNVRVARPNRLRFALNGDDCGLREGDVIHAGQQLTSVGQPQFSPCDGWVAGCDRNHIELGVGHCPDTVTVFEPLKTPDLRAVVDRVRQSGICGMGGAGYPTWRKLSQVPVSGLKALVINAVECEPGLQSDTQLLRTNQNALAVAVELLGRVLQPQHLVVAVKDVGSRLTPIRGVTELVMPRRYPAGDERLLAAAVLGSDASASGVGDGGESGTAVPGGVNSGSTVAGSGANSVKRPLDYGILVLNIATALAVAAAVLQGRVPTSRLVTIHGPLVPESVVVRAPLGSPISSLLASVVATGPEQVVVVGGAMMGQVVDVKSATVTQATTGIYLAPEARRAEACISCMRCDPVCPQGLSVQQLYLATEHADASQLRVLNVESCTGCGCCDSVCPSRIPLAGVLLDARAQQRERVTAEAAAARAECRSEAHTARELARAQDRERKRASRRNGSDTSASNKNGDERAARLQRVLQRARKRDIESDEV